MAHPVIIDHPIPEQQAQLLLILVDIAEGSQESSVWCWTLPGKQSGTFDHHIQDLKNEYTAIVPDLWGNPLEDLELVGLVRRSGDRVFLYPSAFWLARYERVQKQIEEIDQLVGLGRSDPAFVRWFEATKRRIAEVFGQDSEHFKRFNETRFTPGSINANPQKQAIREQTAYSRGLGAARTRLLVCLDELSERMRVGEPTIRASSVSLSSFSAISLEELVRILRRFREGCQYLPWLLQNEADVQAILWTMLRSHFDRLDRHETLSKFGVKGYIPDFGVPDLGTLIEAKFIGQKTEVSRIQEEILADVPGYLNDSTDYDTIVVFVYDAAHKLRDDRKFVEDLTSVDGIVAVVVMPGIGLGNGDG